MHGITYEITPEKLVITVDISGEAIRKAPLSKQGRAFLVASSGSAIPFPSPHSNNLSFSLNVMNRKQDGGSPR